MISAVGGGGVLEQDAASLFWEIERGAGETVRLDKYLKVSRLVKRRTIAKELCDAGRVEVNGRPGKAGLEVKPGDVAVLSFGPRQLQVEILELREQASKEQARSMYAVLNEGTSPG